jgi:UDPglucose 6-dehydrogenase
MNVGIVGTGYVGLVTGACLADFGHTVVCVDTAASRIEALRAGALPFYEPGLAEVVTRNTSAGRLRFSVDLGDAVRTSTVIFIAVGTPEGANGEADLSQLAAAAEAMAKHLVEYRVIATKSTVPVGTGAWLRGYLEQNVGHAEFDIVSNPEFLREGSAISDFLRPDRVVIGTTSERATAIMREIYRPLYLIETPLVVTDVESAEMIKYASNAFLAVKIGFINEIANLCERVGADVHIVAKGMGLDKRIGPKFLHPGPGYGGSCFPKDVKALIRTSDELGLSLEVLKAVEQVNECQKRVVLEKALRYLGSDLRGKIVGIWGLAFKAETDDMRESPAIPLVEGLLTAGARVQTHDPKATDTARMIFGDRVMYAADPYSAAHGADMLAVMTEWLVYRNPDFERVRKLLRRPLLIDGRNLYEPDRMAAIGFEYHGIGRGRR